MRVLKPHAKISDQKCKEWVKNMSSPSCTMSTPENCSRGTERESAEVAGDVAEVFGEGENERKIPHEPRKKLARKATHKPQLGGSLNGRSTFFASLSIERRGRKLGV